MRIHDLRHTFASILIAAGHNLKYVQNQMGHGSIQITIDLYGHLMPEVRTGAAEKSEGFVFGQESKFCQSEEKRESDEMPNSLFLFGSGAWI
jgi:hypothetical protein